MNQASLDKTPLMQNISPISSQSDKVEIDITWKNIIYEVSIKNQPSKLILDDVSGIAKHGETLAIMGASGAGKTSLLNMIGCRINKGANRKINGELCANGQSYNLIGFSKFGCYVMQNDLLMQSLTVYESIEFAARLKLTGSKESKMKRVSDIIKQLGLEKCCNTYVGGPLLRGVSGGERKRTSIGIELVTDPQVLILDEPTSGLDSFTALVLIKILKKQANLGKTIIFTIHQPNYEIYSMFDRLLLLAKGKTIYQGRPQEAINYFNSINFTCPEFTNPAEYFLSISTMDKNEQNENLPIFFEKYEFIQQAQVIEEMNNGSKRSLEDKSIADDSNGRASTWEIFTLLYKRANLNFFRTPILLTARIIQMIFVIFLFNTIYYNSDSGSTFEITQNLGGALFFSAMGLYFGNMFPVIVSFPAERQIFLKETTANMYGITPYFFAKMLTEIPYVATFPTIYSAISYGIVGLNNASLANFGVWCLTLVILALTAHCLGLAAGSIIENEKAVTAIAPMISLPFLVFSGFYVNFNTLGVWISWFQYLSPFKYTLEALFRNQFEDSDITPNPIETFAFNIGKWNSIMILGGLACMFMMLSLIGLKLSSKKLEQKMK